VGQFLVAIPLPQGYAARASTVLALIVPESPDVPDIVVARLLDEVAHGHVFDHAPAQRADGLLALGVLLS
jgi:hypothetical protein